jgi:hypothetical protein
LQTKVAGALYRVSKRHWLKVQNLLGFAYVNGTAFHTWKEVMTNIVLRKVLNLLRGLCAGLNQLKEVFQVDLLLAADVEGPSLAEVQHSENGICHVVTMHEAQLFGEIFLFHANRLTKAVLCKPKHVFKHPISLIEGSYHIWQAQRCKVG